MNHPLFVSIYRFPALQPLRPLARRLLDVTRRIAHSGAVEWLARSTAMPLNWWSSVKAARTLCFSYGHLNSVSKKRSIDAKGEPIPWYTYPAIEYIKQLDFSDKSVFEYGAGNSTVFWSRIAERVVSVEHDEGWHRMVSRQVTAAATVIFEPDLDCFVSTITRVRGPFDVIVVDGPARGRTRLKCCRAARDYLNDGGVIILDNSEWLPESTAFLRSTGLLQVDMTGFAPLNANTGTTSFFFDRRFNVRPKRDKQPTHGIGSLACDWESLRGAPGASVDVAGETWPGVELDQRFSIATRDGRRAFRFLLYHLDETTTALAIIDEDANRVLLDGHCILKGKGGRGRQLAEMRWIQRMTYEELRTFVNKHRRRRYML
jgi:Methyltransferase domain